MTRLPFDGTREARAAIAAAIADEGFVVVVPATPRLSADAFATDPWSAVESFFDAPATMVERQPIRPVAGARSFAAGSGDAPLHTDSQPFDGCPAHVQLMACRAPAARGGESLLVDAFALAERLAVDAPDLFHALVHTRRVHRFYFGAYDAPTLSVRGSELFFTHAPFGRDALAVELARVIPPPKAVSIAAGEVLVVDNHRMLHGRTAFDDASRAFERILAWLPAPLSPAHPLRARVGLEIPARTRAVDPRERALFALLRGVPPGVVAQRFSVAEDELYALRDAALAALRRAL